jgi:hypothetical protein
VVGRPPEVIREKVNRLTGGRLACVLILDREPTGEEISRFFRLPADDRPVPTDFQVSGRVVTYECADADEAKWRLAAEIFLVKCHRDPATTKPLTGARDTRSRFGLRPLHRG